MKVPYGESDKTSSVKLLKQPKNIEIYHDAP